MMSAAMSTLESSEQTKHSTPESSNALQTSEPKKSKFKIVLIVIVCLIVLLLVLKKVFKRSSSSTLKTTEAMENYSKSAQDWVNARIQKLIAMQAKCTSN
jgi:flagellar biosynthesis/type III secretory pathway M-ring protein FliF/YscJ